MDSCHYLPILDEYTVQDQRKNQEKWLTKAEDDVSRTMMEIRGASVSTVVTLLSLPYVRFYDERQMTTSSVYPIRNYCSISS
jgi:hypothetical protein